MMGWTLVTAVWRDDLLLCGNLQSGAGKQHHIGGFIIFYVEMRLAKLQQKRKISRIK